MNHAVSPPFGPDLSGVGAARAWARAVLVDWDGHVDVDLARLVVSELVTNALVHAKGSATVALRLIASEAVLEVTVDDDGPLQPTAPGAPDEGHRHVEERDPDRVDGGRGLLIVDAVARAWGWRPTPSGKQAWAHLTIGAPDDHAAQERRHDTVSKLVASGVSSPVMTGLVELARELLGARHARVSLRGRVEVVAAAAGPDEVPADVRLQLVDRVLAHGPLSLGDVRLDRRLGAAAGLRGYLGVPLVVADVTVGVLAVDDDLPRRWTAQEAGVLERLARSAAADLALQAVTADLAHSATRLAVSLDAANVGGFELDPQTGELWWDARLIEMFGYDPTTFTAHLDAFTERLHPDDRTRMGDAIATAVATLGELAEQYRIVLPSGAVRWITARGRCVVTELGRSRLVGAAFDSTKAHDESDRIVRVLETMTDAFYSLDREWRFTYVNGPAERLLGRSRSDLVGANIWRVFPAAVGTAFSEQFDHVMATGEPVAFEESYPAPVDGRFELRAWATPEGISVVFLDVSERHRAEQERERALLTAQAVRDRVELLADMTRALVSTLDVDEALARLVHLLVPRFADWASVTLVDENGQLRHSVARHRDPDRRADVEEFARLHMQVATERSRSHTVVRTGQPVLVNGTSPQALSVGWRGEELTQVLSRLGLRNVMLVPLSSRDRVLGVVILAGDPSREAFSDTDLSTATEIGRRAGLAVDNAQLYSRQRTAAEVLQRHLLPALPKVPGLSITARYVPAAQEAQVGGDFYWGAVQPGGHTLVAIGDVSGHDLAATSWQAQLAPLLRGFAFESSEGPAWVLGRVDRAMDGLAIDTMATAVLADIAPAREGHPGRLLRFSNAGHLPPVLVRAADGAVELLSTPPELLLGLDPHTVRRDHERRLLTGDTLLLCTDGLVERRGSDLDADLARLRDVLAGTSAMGLEDLADTVLEQLTATTAVTDDVALLAVRLDQVPPQA